MDKKESKKVKTIKPKKQKTKSENSTKNKSKKKSIGWLIFKIFIFTMIAVCIIGAGLALGY